MHGHDDPQITAALGTEALEVFGHGTIESTSDMRISASMTSRSLRPLCRFSKLKNVVVYRLWRFYRTEIFTVAALYRETYNRRSPQGQIDKHTIGNGRVFLHCAGRG